MLQIALIVVVCALIIIPATLVTVNHGYNLINPASQSPLGAGIVVPETPLPEDDAFARLSKIAGRIHKTLEVRDCLGEKPPFRLDWDCMVFLDSQVEVLKSFDEWLAGPLPYKLERPVNLGRHSRLPLPRTYFDNANVSDLSRFKALTRLLALRALRRLDAGNVALAEQDLRTIFSIGSFLQQNPSIISLMYGSMMHRIGLKVIVQHMPPGSIGERLEIMLPTPQPMLDGLRIGIGGEWVMAQESIDRLGSGDTLYGDLFGPAFRVLGLYNREHSLQLAALAYRSAQNHLASGRLGRSFRAQEHIACNFETMGMIKWIHNPYGRWLACESQPTFLEDNVIIGQTIDMVAATQVIIEARRSWLHNSRWPAQESDFVPAYLKQWPRSALDGQPFQWMANKPGVNIAHDGESLCPGQKEGELCSFQFEPPKPIPSATATHFATTSMDTK